MTLFMVLVSCNSGGVAEDPQSKFLKSVIDLGNDFLNVFTSFGDIVSKVLGFSTEAKKSDVGAYFKTVQDTIQGTKDKLNKIVADMKREGNPNASATETAVKTLIDNTLDKIIEGAKTASDAIGITGDDLLGNVAATNAAGAAGTEVDKLVKGIKAIVEVVLKDKGNADAGDDKKAEDGNTARTAAAGDGEAGKLFTAGAGAAGDANNAKKVAADAAKAVGAVTGADILQAMIKDNGDAAKLATAQNAGAAPKDGAIAGGIALRVMAKGGKFAGPSAAADDAVTAIKGAAISAVTKALDTLTIAIRKTIDVGLKTVKEAMKINANDTPISPDQSAPKATTTN
ncbi:Variable outer membrane protein (plasmid) [Borrelia nietonii YOR]|uniref:Variable large protein n=2 Tax=Borrelia TaxID=138 RepID=W5SH71_9SPIR|nr:variable large family protein [Borrelia nietonii]AHH04436.1 Variable outer membrane protein [Borrelia nietonii YOR]UPA09988.1 variable large family protein [Borrelia nietonii YOR]